ncbi:hypothetical protein VTJ04DRAFT_7361 [Mycothermus thermophilus]|uniref:uncharacterized protein n=1 Tax=Humicola insolens TaxID=85995 RepID=UPI0037426458
MTPKSITCIGIGNMGAALAGALLTGSAAPTAQSPNLTLWNRTPDRPQVRALVEQGAVLETNLATAVANSEVVVICLLDYPSVMAVFSALEGGQGGSPLANKVIVNLTNGTASQARASSTYFKQVLGAAAYFDGAIMVVPQQVGTAESFMVLSGESQAGYDTLVRDVLTPIGATLYLGSNPDGPTPRNDEGESDPGAAALHDLAALSAMYGMFIGAFTGFALLQNGLKNGQTKSSNPWRLM